MYFYSFYALLVFFTLFILHIVKKYGRMGKLLSLIPTRKPLLPIIGNTVIIFWNADSQKAWNAIRNMFKEFYPITLWWSVTFPTVFIWDPEDTKRALENKVNLEKSSFYKYLCPFANTGLLTAGVDKSKKRRKLINPAFHLDVLKKYLEVTNEHTKEFIDYFRKLDNNTVQNLSSTISKLILTIMTETSTGIHHKFFEESIEFYERAILDAFDIFAYRAIRTYIPDWLFRFLPAGSKQNKIIKEFDNFINRLIKTRESYHESTDFKYMEAAETEDENFIGQRKKFATLDRLLWLKKKGLIDEEGVIEEVKVIIVAAHDTTTLALIFNLLLLAENEEAQERARKEAIEVIEQTDGNLNMDDVKGLEYIDRCLKESLRIFPPGPMFGRSITEELHLKDHIIPVGADLIINPFDVHRDPKYWKNPLKFDPDRFLPERIREQHPYTYIPFSAGPRNCIGKKLAQVTLKALIAHILYNFKLEPVTISDKIKFKLSVVLSPQEPIYVRFIKINRPQITL